MQMYANTCKYTYSQSIVEYLHPADEGVPEAAEVVRAGVFRALVHLFVLLLRVQNSSKTLVMSAAISAIVAIHYQFIVFRNDSDNSVSEFHKRNRVPWPEKFCTMTFVELCTQ